MSLLNFDEIEPLGTVISVDTASVVVQVSDTSALQTLQVNRLVVLESRPGQQLVGVVQKITRSEFSQAQQPENVDTNVEFEAPTKDLVRVTLIGTLFDKLGTEPNVFRRTLESVPSIDAYCYPLEGTDLTNFMGVISGTSADTETSLSIGHYALDEEAEAYLNGDKLFQRHAIIVGSTGSGKSWTTAQILEQISQLPNANAIVFDIHGEYKPFTGEGFQHLRVANPTDLNTGDSLPEGVLYLPYWLLPYEGLTRIFVDRSDDNAPNQTMLISRLIYSTKESVLRESGYENLADDFTIDSPVPFSFQRVEQELERLDNQMVEGAKAGSEKAGPYKGKLSRLIARMQNKTGDRRLGFLFQGGDETMRIEYLDRLATALLGTPQYTANPKGGVKIIDFSEVPSDVLPLIVSMVGRLIFSLQQWSEPSNRHPVSIFCDEAHNYIPHSVDADRAGDFAVSVFERIAKEGRKYGVGLVTISQRPSEVNRTVLSQSNNVVSMRLTNAEDQNVIKRLLPDSLGGFGELLPVLDTGEALVVGDASLLPSRIRIRKPNVLPNSATVPFWTEWNRKGKVADLTQAAENWRWQSSSPR